MLMRYASMNSNLPMMLHSLPWSGAERVMRECQLVNRAFGLIASIPKAKLMLAGRETTADDKALPPSPTIVDQ